MQLKNLIGFNIHAEVENDTNGRGGNRNILYNYLDKTKPPFHLVLNRFDFAIDLAKRYPESKIIVRYYPDDFHLTHTPEHYIRMVESDWLKAKSMGVNNLSFHTTNEPSKSKNLIDWHVKVMNLAITKNIPLTILNLAIGAFNPEDFYEFEPILKLCAKRPDLFLFGIHEYFVALPSSGMPIADGKGGYTFPIFENQWDRTSDLTRWHCGRHQFLLDVCDKLNIPRPNLVITEHGQDRLDEDGKNWVAKWVYSLNGHIRGWKTSNNQWRLWFSNYKEWFSEPYKYNMSFVYAKMLYYLQEIYQSNYKGKSRNIQGVMLFSWWNSGKIGSSQDWTNFRVDNEPELLKYLESLFNTKPVFENPKSDDSRWKEYKIRSRQVSIPTNVYKMPEDNKPVNMIDRTWLNVRLISFDNMSDNEKEVSKGEWLLIYFGSNANTIGWIKSSEIEVFTEPNYSDLLEIIDSAFSRLNDIKNMLTVIKDRLEKK